MDISFLLLFSFLTLVLGILGASRTRLWIACTQISALAAVLAGLAILLGTAPWVWSSTMLLGDTPLSLQLDALSAFFLVLLAVVASSASWYSLGYWTDTTHPQTAPQGRRWWNTMLLGMGGVLLNANGLHFLLSWEVFAISAYFLVTLECNNTQVRAAGWLYLAASHTGTLALFAFFAILATKTGSWALKPWLDHPDLAPIFWLALLGFGLKAGIFGLHIWLPSAHANAPSHVSALLSGMAIKIGIYGLFRFSGWMSMPFGADWAIAGLGCISAVLGVAFALGQHDLKRLLAYHSVENIGIILMGLGFALLAKKHNLSTWGLLALTGGILHIWNHGLFKSLLFLGAGAVVQSTGTRTMSSLGGLWRAMPWTATLFSLGSVAICALPPLNGFVSEWLIYSGLFDASLHKGGAGIAAAIAAVLLAITGALALACFIKACGVVFLGAPRSQHSHKAQECVWTMRAPMLFLAACCVTIGIFPTVVWHILRRVSLAWSGASSIPTQVPSSLHSLGIAHLIFLISALVIGGATYLYTRHRTSTGPTWDCGFNAPTARMQYTAGSFASIIVSWFTWILHPKTQEILPATFFPQSAQSQSHTPETVLEEIVEPTGKRILNLADLVTRFQHGHIQSYILYLAVGIFVLAFITILAINL